MLTKRQTEYLQLIADGKTAHEVAALEQRSIKTVEAVLKRVRTTLRARTIAHAVAAALRQELIE